MNKKEIRTIIKARVKALSARERAVEAVQLLSAVSTEPHFVSAKNVLIYNPLPDEIDVLPILERFKAVKRFFMPVVCADILKILPYTEQQCVGAYNISEPVGLDYVSINDIDLVIVPGVGFTADGYRLGRGKGYYDRLLSGAACYKIGVCFSCQIEPAIGETAEPHDVKMDCVLFSKC
ncbi:MAG: 5-formyltetrahydrofolate cyclo-ligase [Paludibacteraceae bacterium]|nr:5-formyltetrahydrofolate cyclo-ligase [Paludibacteraceae bacterium]